MTGERVVLSTAGSQEEARRIARALVERSLAACVNVSGPIESTYRWQGAVETTTEYLLLIKTTGQAVAAVGDTIRQLHSYELPEVVVLAIEDGSREYLQWIEESVQV